MFNTLFYPTTMNRKEYLIAQGNVQKDVSALAETLKTQLAVFPEAIKVGEELKVIGFKGETLNDLYLICTRGEDEEVYELKYTILTRKLKLTSWSGIRANRATFFSPRDASSSSSVAVSAATLARLNFSSRAAKVI